MGTFPHRSPYSKDGDVRMIEENNDGLGSYSDADELEIDPDLSDADLLVRQAEAGEDQRDLAAATLANIERYRQLWALFCSTLLKGKPDPVSALGKCNVKGFKLFFVWYSTRYPRAKRLNTFQGIWKGIHQVYYDTFRTAIDERLSHEFSNWLRGSFCKERHLIRGNRPKQTLGYDAVVGALCYHWIFDTDRFPTERDRLQLALYVLFLAYTGARPGAISESNCKGICGTNEALKYKDIQLKLVRPAGGAAPLLVMKLRIVLDKGRRKRGEEKTLTLYENCFQPVMCPIVYFLALAFVDNAFHPELIPAGLSVRRLHSFACPSGTIDFSFREEILDTPVFRSSSRGLYGKQTSGSRASSANNLGRWSARLGQRAGLPHPITPYCLRREVATSLTDAGFSQPQLLQILGHRKIDTYLRHYQSTEVRVDVQATFLGTTSKANMIKEIGRLCIRDDSNLPRSLTPEQRIQVLCDPEIQRLEQRRRELKTKCQDDNADSALRHAEYTGIGKQLKSMKRIAENRLFQQILWDYHATADRKHMLAQLKNEPVPAARLSQADFPFEERQRLATALFQETTEESFAQIVEDLSTLCTKSEVARQGFIMTALLQAQVARLGILGPAIHNEPSSAEVSAAATDTTVADSLRLSTCDKTPKPQDHFHVIEDVIEGSGALPITSTLRERLGGFTRYCLFCSADGKTGKLYSRPFALRRHYEDVHLRYQTGPLDCPVPRCAKVLTDDRMFANHAVAVHRNDIGVRATLKSPVRVQKKRGRLPTIRTA